MGLLSRVANAISGRGDSEDIAELEYHNSQHPPRGNENQYSKPIGPVQPTANPNHYKTPIGPEPQQPGKMYPKPAGPSREMHDERTREAAEAKEKKFQDEQAAYNLRKKQEYAHEKYVKEQEELIKQKKMKTFGQTLKSKAGDVVKPLYDIRKKNMEKMKPKDPGKEKPLTKTEVAKMIASKQKEGKRYGSKTPPMTRGQFSSPMGRTGFGSMEGMVHDPFSGLTALKKKTGKKKLGFNDWFKF